MKIVNIDGKKFGVRLPFGGTDRDDHDNDWDNALDAGCPLNWRNTLSWCMESIHDNQRVARGYYSARFWVNYAASIRAPRLGFRPVLVPLDPDTLEPDLNVYAGRNGETIELCVDIHGNRIKWAIFDGKLIAVNNLAFSMSWNDLDKMGYVPHEPEKSSTPKSVMHMKHVASVNLDIEVTTQDILRLIDQCENPEELRHIARYAKRQAEAIEHPDVDDFRSRA